MLWRTSRAKILARQGDLERAESLAREAVRMGEPTDLVNTRADALSDLAEVLALAGRREEALAALEEAAQLYERKGNLTALRRAHSAAERLTVAPSSA
jgi:tetratricopeptide (TPR) repeat protein